MLTETGVSILTSAGSILAAAGPLQMFWQVLAILAVVGLVIISIMAMIEPGPLVKRRPFSRKQRSRRQESHEANSTDRKSDPGPPDADEDFDQDGGGRRRADGRSSSA